MSSAPGSTFSELRTTPDWLIPQTIEGIGFSLADAVYRLTKCPAAVVVRDPATETASVVAASVGADRRLWGMRVAPGSAAGRACVGDVTAFGSGAVDLIGARRADRRRHEEQGVAVSLNDGRQSVGAIVVFTPPGSVNRTMNEELAALAKQAGQVIGRALRAQLVERRGLIDEVTGQPNLAGLEHAMRDLVRSECSLICVDIDQVAELDRGLVNPVLRQIADVLRSTVRDSDVPARLDNDAFALLLPDTALANAVKVAARVRQAVNEASFDIARPHRFTCSAGVAAIPDSVSDVDELLAAAAAAKEKAKAGGRNRVEQA
jgi:diguanylate cyclase (GGDEF)-like protein